MSETTTLPPRYETVVGLEVHVELSTASKMFCSCPTTFGAEPNTQVCPICLGLPGTLPVPNKRAIEFAIRAALALNCEINPETKFDRKNYHYPDLPKGYQTSQYDEPLAENGYLIINLDGEERQIRIRRLHLEEDAGKSLHEGVEDASLVDFNRGGMPLIEIVSEPDIRSPEEARLYLQKLRAIMRYTDVSDVKMEEGSLRCDANISIHPVGSDQWGELTEVKNMNSFRSVQRALEYEARRQAARLDAGERVVRETRHWHEARGETIASRSKEEAHDYRYFPEPDLVPLEVDRAWVEEIQAAMPELPDERLARYVEQYGLPEYDAGVLVNDIRLAAFFDETVAEGANPKTAANWLISEVLGFLNNEGRSLEETPLTPAHLAGMLKLIEDGTISGKIAKTVFEEMARTGKPPGQIVEEKGLKQISDTSEIEAMVEQVIDENPSVVEDYRGGKEKALGFLVGQVMKASRGKANPGMVNELLRQKLS